MERGGPKERKESPGKHELAELPDQLRRSPGLGASNVLSRNSSFNTAAISLTENRGLSGDSDRAELDALSRCRATKPQSMTVSLAPNGVPSVELSLWEGMLNRSMPLFGSPEDLLDEFGSPADLLADPEPPDRPDSVFLKDVV